MVVGLFVWLLGVFTATLLAARKRRNPVLHFLAAALIPFFWPFQIVYLIIVPEKLPPRRRYRRRVSLP